MRRAASIFLIMLLIVSNLAPSSFARDAENLTTVQSTPRSEVVYDGERRINFNENWRFQRETDGSIGGVQNPTFDDSK